MCVSLPSAVINTHKHTYQHKHFLFSMFAEHECLLPVRTSPLSIIFDFLNSPFHSSFFHESSHRSLSLSFILLTGNLRCRCLDHLQLYVHRSVIRQGNTMLKRSPVCTSKTDSSNNVFFFSFFKFWWAFSFTSSFLPQHRPPFSTIITLCFVSPCDDVDNGLRTHFSPTCSITGVFSFFFHFLLIALNFLFSFHTLIVPFRICCGQCFFLATFWKSGLPLPAHYCERAIFIN